jgi:N-acetylmuramoyl-L-alanine amidase
LGNFGGIGWRGQRMDRVTRLATYVALVGLWLLCGPVEPTGASPPRVVTASNSVTGGHAIDQSYFEPGSCESFRPTAGDRHRTVFLDAGHGGLDPGGIGVTESGQTIYEAAETLPVELAAMSLLRANGFDVVVSRTRSSTVVRPQPGDISNGLFTVEGEGRDIAARDVCANMTKANILIGIYFDAGASPLNAGSVTGYDAVRPFATQNLRLATLVQTDVLAAMNAQGWTIPDAGVVPDAALGGPALSDVGAAYGHLMLLGPSDPGYFSTPSRMPGALIEPLFITDPLEGSLAASALGQKVIAGGLANAVEQYFDPGQGASAKQSKGGRSTDQAASHAG